MKIREGAYYRTRGGHVVGPMYRNGLDAVYPWAYFGICWRDDGRFSVHAKQSAGDLISEVYVSDTPIFRDAHPFIHPAPDGPNGPFRIAPETKTLRDEFAIEAMKLLIPRHERREETLAEFAYRQADAMMEARKK